MSDTGTKISQFKELQLDDSTENKILLVLEPTDNGSVNYKDRYITFKDFENQIFEDFGDYAGFQDMVFQNKEDYSSSNHDHAQYTGVSVIVNQSFSDNNSIAKIGVGNINYDIKQTFEDPSYSTRTEIGELRFVATQKMNTNIDIYSDDFDGWVFADGRKYYTKSSQDFLSAKANFLTANGGLAFKVPNLNNFIRPSLQPLDYTSCYNTTVPSNTMDNIPYHTHVMKMELNGNITTTMQTNTTLKKDSKGVTFSRGNGNSTTKNVSVKSSLSVDYVGLTGMRTYTSGDATGETYPSHNLLPVMIYIGLRK